MKTKAEIVEEVLTILNSPEKWCKHTLVDRHAHCLMGAVNIAVTGHPLYSVGLMTTRENIIRGAEVVKVMDEVAVEKGYTSDWGIGSGQHAVMFNNAPETEYEDIRLFLKEVLERVS